MNRLLLILTLIAAVSGIYAQEDDETVGSTAVGFSSQRVFRGVDQAGAGGAGTFQVMRHGWRLAAEISREFKRNGVGEGTLTGSYGWNVTRQFKMQAMVTPRWFSEVALGMTARSVEAGLSADWELPSGFTVELAAFHDWRLKAETLQATLNYSMPLKNLGAYLEWSACVGTSSSRDLRPDAPGPVVHDAYSFYSASVRLPYRISARNTLVAGLHLAESANQSRFWSPILASGGFRAWFDVGLSFDF